MEYSYFYDDPSALLSTRALARKLGVHIETVRRWARARKIPLIRVGPRGRIRFNPDQVWPVLKHLRQPESAQSPAVASPPPSAAGTPPDVIVPEPPVAVDQPPKSTGHGNTDAMVTASPQTVGRCRPPLIRDLSFGYRPPPPPSPSDYI